VAQTTDRFIPLFDKEGIGEIFCGDRGDLNGFAFAYDSWLIILGVTCRDTLSL